MSTLIEGEDYYLNDEGLMVLTSSYHLNRKQCCGNGCIHCPYSYKNVETERRNILLKKQPPIILLNKKNCNIPMAKSTKKADGTFTFFDDVYDVVRQIPKGYAPSNSPKGENEASKEASEDLTVD